MLKKGLLLATLLISTLLTGCANIIAYNERVYTPLVEVARPEPNQAAVVFYRPSRFGWIESLPFAEAKQDGSYRFIAALNVSKIRVEKFTPGVHYFVTGGEGQNMLKATLEPGKVYFVKIYPTMGLFKGRVSIEPTRGLARYEAQLLKKLVIINPTESARKDHADSMAEHVKAALEGKTNRPVLELLPEDGITYEEFQALMK